MGPQCRIPGGFSSRRRCRRSKPSKASRFLLGIYKPTSDLWRELPHSVASALARVLRSEDRVVQERGHQTPCTSQAFFQLRCSHLSLCSLLPALIFLSVLHAGGIAGRRRRGSGRPEVPAEGTACARAEVGLGEGTCAQGRHLSRRPGRWGASSFCFSHVKRA